MRHEGDTVAGESPGKSDQLKSSGETAAGENDPRLSVFRESSAEKAGTAEMAESESGSGSAVATKVATAKREGVEEGTETAEEAGDSDDGPIMAETTKAAETKTPEAGKPAEESEPDTAEEPEEPAAAEEPEPAEERAEEPEPAEKPAEPVKGDEKPAEEPEPVAEKKPEPVKGDAKPDPDVKPAPEATPDPDVKVPSWAKPATDEAAPDADKATEAKAATEDKAATEAKAATEDKAGTGAKATGDSEAPEAPEAARSADSDKPKPERSAPSEQPDQATAVFKAVRKPAVDQPTTALKLPQLPAADAAEKSDRSASNESGERASTFVPLRRDDKPTAPSTPAAAPKPAAAKPAEPKPAPSGSGPAAPVPSASVTTTTAIPEAERTRQQPLPPMPPLDLLAELTNTPETRMRTVVRRVKIWTPLVLLGVVVFAVVQAVRPLPVPELALTADSSYTFEGDKPSLAWPDHGQGAMSVAGLGAMGAFGEEKPVPIASVTKSMTAYIIMRDHPMKVGQDGAVIPVDATAEKEGGYDESNDESTLNTIKKGDKLSQRDALSALMIPSANNVARLLARWDAGSQDEFVKKMNETAKELGMTNTTYTDPSGLDATTVSTAADQVKLGLELVKMPALMTITALPSWTDPSGKTWRNWNTLVPYDGAIGIKTGTTTKAGGNLLFAAKKDVGGTEQYLVGAVLGQQGPSIIDAVNAASKKVMLATQDALVAKTVVKKGDTVGYVDDGLGGRVPVTATKDLTVAGWPGLKITVKLSDGGEQLPHTAETGTVVGELTVGSGPGQVKAPVALQEALVEPGFGAKLTRIS
ncbi:D-alanyl-D-alanine carboxypeptidase [Streptomyces sp. NPDC088554]|uniref:D-alanyl-D-alanine carboxypeptidase n=1 Tax=Streptomyces sp. NPDC088554 TaxID=3365865 RepID=UPI0038275C4C